ncbi:hypothetical protein GF318_03510 [Candidatus Micrarchaeota archaeon]|nr:hypothetical protein [Candidatus Micrarchaeota archaeon]
MSPLSNMRIFGCTFLFLFLLAGVSMAVNVSSCENITSPGVYQLTADLSGAPNNVSGISGISWACIKIASSDVVLECGAHSITNDGTADAVGILVNGSGSVNYPNVTIRDCPSISLYEDGVYVYYTNETTVHNVTSHNNTAWGFHVYYTDYSNFTGNVAYNNSGGFYPSGDYLRVHNNTARNNTGNGFDVYTDGLAHCNVTENRALDNGGSGFWGFGDGGPLLLENNIARGNGGGGIVYERPSSLFVYNNTVEYNGYGIEMYMNPAGSSECKNNTARYNSNDGFLFAEGGADYDVRNNLAHDNNGSGFYLGDAAVNYFINNTAYNNQLHGFEHTGDGSGVSPWGNNTAYGNGLGGLYLSNWYTTELIEGDHYYNNGYDILLNASDSGFTCNLSRVVVDNPSGGYQKYTTLSINDSLSLNELYFINWTANETAYPATSFNDKLVNISVLGGTPSIDSIVWHWTDAEVLITDDESSATLWKYNNTGWSLLGGSLDTAANTLSLSSLNPASHYGVFMNSTNATYINLYGANVTNISRHARYQGGSAGNADTEGGNVSGVNISSSTLTEKWAAFYGNVTGNIVLTDVVGTNILYSWLWEPADGGVVCLSTNSSLATEYVAGASGSDIDNAWGFTATASDSGANTFNGTDCDLPVGSATVNDSAYADTGAAGGFRTCAVKATSSPAKDQMIFCSEIAPSGTSWNGLTVNFELMVPTPEAVGSTETYYFYANLN